MQKTIVTLILSLVVLVSACHKRGLNHSCNKKSRSCFAVCYVAPEIKNVIIDSNTNMADTGTAYTIDSLKINNDILSLFVNYSGGCKIHSFELFSNGAYGKSLPPQISVCLKHTGNEDACRQLITEEVKFNISKLKYKGQNTVIIHVGNKQGLYYVTQ